jgi:hypothetical protein
MTLAGAGPEPDKQPPSADDIARAKKVVESDEKLKVKGAIIQPIEDAALGRALPHFVFIAAWFRQFPVARVVPEGLKTSNVFAVDRDGKATLLTDAKDLEKFFRANLAPARDEMALKDAAAAWVRMAQQLYNDGFYKFRLLEDATKVTPTGEGKTVSATAVVMAGGSGTVGATLTFDEAGKLVKAVEDVRLRPGPRPICQATKLLDPDPIVRRMAEADLLIMGMMAQPYLLEQRAKACPELCQAIDRLWKQIEDQEK